MKEKLTAILGLLALLFVLLISFPDETYAQSKGGALRSNSKSDNLSHLKNWIGKYPYDPKRRHNPPGFRNFFEIPEIKSRLISILKNKGLKKLIADYGFGFDKIELIEDFFVTLSVGPGDERLLPSNEVQYVLIAIAVKGGEARMVYVHGDKMGEESNRPGELPLAVEEKVGIYWSKWRDIHPKTPQ